MRSRAVVIRRNCCLLGAVALLLAASCSGTGEFGQPCADAGDCESGFCVGGEAGGVELQPFCSEDCEGRPDGSPCAEGVGICGNEFTSWCWVECRTNTDCFRINPDRGQCSPLSVHGVMTEYRVCVAGP